MFQVGFQQEIFSDRHPQMGLSVSDLQTWWRDVYPKAKTGLQPLSTQQLPGTVPIAPKLPPPAPVPSSGGSTALWVGGLAVLGLGAYYFLAKRPFGIKK